MKAMILAAGRGERLRPLTDTTPKPLIKAGDKRLIEYLITALVKAGFNDLVINYAHLGEQFPAILGDGSRYGANIQYSPELAGGLETAGGIINALPLLDSEQFLVVNGDIWTDFDFRQLHSLHLDANTLCHLVLVDNPAHHPSGDFSLIDQRIRQDDTAQKLTFSGIGLYQRRFFANLPVTKTPLKPLFLRAIEQQQISGEHYQGAWSDIGTLTRLQALERQLKQNSP